MTNPFFQSILKKFPSFPHSKKFLPFLYGLIVLLLLLGVFELGVFVGFHKARFTSHMNENYERTFGRFHNGLPTLIESGEMPNTHGASGMVIKVQLPTIVVLGPDQVEQTLLTNDHTLVKHFRSDASLTDIHENDFIVAIGSPNDHAQIETRFIRILPPPPAGILHSPLQSTTTPLTTSPHNNSI